MAMKVIDQIKLDQIAETIDTNALKKLDNHENILKYVEHFYLIDTNKLCIITEYCEVNNKIKSKFSLIFIKIN